MSNAENVPTVSMESVEKVIEEKIRPALQSHGGDIELLDVENGVVRVKLQGACHGCPGAMATLKNGVQRLLQEDLPDVKEVVAA